MSKTKSELTLLLTALIFGTGFIGTEICLESMSPSMLLVFRLFFASVFLFLLKSKHIIKHFKDNLKLGFITAIFFFLGFVTQTLGQYYSNPVNCAFITSIYVIFVPIVAFVLSGKKTDRYTLISILLMVVGVGLLTLNETFTMASGDIYSIFCAVFFAVQVYLVGYYGKKPKTDSITYTFMQLFFSGIFSMIYALATDTVTVELTNKSLLSIIYLTLIVTVIGFFLQVFAQKDADETSSGLILSLESLFGAVLSMILFKTIVNPQQILGIIIIMSAIFTNQTKFKFTKKLIKKKYHTSKVYK